MKLADIAELAPVAEARGKADAVKNKYWSLFKGLVASRVAVALAALCLVAFGAHAALAPGRLPPFSTLGLAQMGIVEPLPKVDLGLTEIGVTDAEIRGQAQEARAAARPYLDRAWDDLLKSAPWLTQMINLLGAALAGGALISTMALQARRR